MATKLVLRDSASDVTVGSATNKQLTLAQGSSVVSSDATATVNGPTSGVQVKKSSVVLTWFSRPLNSVTVSGTVTFNLWGLESATQANAGFDVLVERCDESGNVVSTISRSERGTELATSAGLNNWTATPTSTALSSRDRIKVTVFGNDAGGTMASGRTFTLNYGAGTGVNGDSYVQFNESVTESTSATVTASKGTFTETGNAASLNLGYLLTAAKGTFTESGNSASLLGAHKLTASVGALTETGISASLTHGSRLVTASGAFSETGRSAGLLATHGLNAVVGSVSESGIQANTVKGYKVNAVGGSFFETGNNAELAKGAIGFTLTAGNGVFPENGRAVGLVKGFRVNTASGTFDPSGNDASLRSTRTINAAPFSFAAVGADANLSKGRRLSANAGSFVESGAQIPLVVVRRSSCLTGSVFLSLNDADTVFDHSLSCANGSLNLAGNDCAFISTSGINLEMAANRGRFNVYACSCGMLARLSECISSDSFVSSGESRVYQPPNSSRVHSSLERD